MNQNQILDEDFNQNLQASIPTPSIRYAGFWVRVLATLLDGCALLPLTMVGQWNDTTFKSLEIALIILVFHFIYKPFMESQYSATLGKMALSLKVVDKQLKPITMRQAIIRYIPWMFSDFFAILLAIQLYNHPDFHQSITLVELQRLNQKTVLWFLAILSSFITLISIIVIVFNTQKKGLHDYLAKTYCIYKK